MKPSVTELTEEDSTLRFRLSGVNTSIANALRRIMLSEIPCVVFKTASYADNKVEIEINTTRMNNELIKQRVSCIPIHITDTSFPIENYIVELDKINNGNVIEYATTGDFVIRNTQNDTILPKSAVIKIFPPDQLTGDFIDIARLRPKIASESDGEHLKFTAKFDIGTAKEDGSFGVVSTCAYAATPDRVRIEKELKQMATDLKSKGLSANDIEFQMKDWKLLKGQTFTIPNSFDFSVKSIGQFENMDIVNRAAHVMSSKLDKFKSVIAENPALIKPSETTIPNSYDITLEGEDYTLGKAIEYVLYSQHYDPSGKATHSMNFCGFRKPHPHIDISIIRVGFVSPTESAILVGILSDAAVALKEVFNNIADVFNRKE